MQKAAHGSPANLCSRAVKVSQQGRAPLGLPITLALTRGQRAVDDRPTVYHLAKQCESSVHNYCTAIGKPALAKKACASARVMVVSTAPTAATMVSKERAPARRSACFALAKAGSIGLKSGE